MPTTVGEPADPMLNIGAGEGRLRPPSNPRPTAPLPGQDADGGRRPPNPRAGALMAERAHCRGRRPRHAGGARRLEGEGGGWCVALRRGHRPPPPPARGRADGLPAGMNRAAGAGWERPPNPKQPALQAPGFRDADRPFGGGSLPAPLPAQNAGSGFGGMRPKRDGANGFRERSRGTGTQLSTKQAGVCPCFVRMWPRG